MDWFDRNVSVFEFAGAAIAAVSFVGGLAYTLYRYGVAAGMRRAQPPEAPPAPAPAPGDRPNACLDAERRLRDQARRAESRIDAATRGDVYARSAEADLIRPRKNGPRQVISVINFKGGVGKTTLCQNLAAYVADKDRGLGLSVLLLDLDYQRTLSDPLAAMAGTEPNNSVWGLFKEDASVELIRNSVKHVPPSPFPHQNFRPLSFLTSDFELQQLEDKLKIRWALKETKDDLRFRLKRLLGEPTFDSADVVIIDCPPRQTMLTINALAASTHFLTPTRPDRFSTRAIGPIYREIAKLRSVLWPDLQPLGVVGTMTRGTAPSARELDMLRGAAATAGSEWGAGVRQLRATIPMRVNIAEPPASGFGYFVGYNGGDTTSSHAMVKALGDEILGEPHQ